MVLLDEDLRKSIAKPNGTNLIKVGRVYYNISCAPKEVHGNAFLDSHQIHRLMWMSLAKRLKSYKKKKYTDCVYTFKVKYH